MVLRAAAPLVSLPLLWGPSPMRWGCATTSDTATHQSLCHPICFVAPQIANVAAPPVQVVGEGRCPIIDSWWQTETGAAMLVPLPGAWEPTPTSATLPFFGVAPVLLDEKVSCVGAANTVSSEFSCTSLLELLRALQVSCSQAEAALLCGVCPTCSTWPA